MHVLKKFRKEDLKFEYGLNGIRLLPWDGLNVPFGGAYCIVEAGTSSLEHVNEPSDEEELFICINGEAEVVIDDRVFPVCAGDIAFMPRGTSHYVRNRSDKPFHFYALWWNSGTAKEYLLKHVKVED